LHNFFSLFEIEKPCKIIEQHVLDTNAGKQVSQAATDVKLTLTLKKWTAFKYRLELWPPDVSK
jgi:hypothetical protein